MSLVGVLDLPLLFGEFVASQLVEQSSYDRVLCIPT